MALDVDAGAMALVGLCHMCGAPSTQACVMCGRVTCDSHLRGSVPPVCNECASGRRGEGPPTVG